MKTNHLLPLAILVALSVVCAAIANSTNGTSEEDLGEIREVNTSGVISNIAYFHMLYSFGVADFENPFECLLKLRFEEDLAASAKERAKQCPSKEERIINNNYNYTEFFMVSQFQKHNLSAAGRKRLRENEKEWPHVLPISRVIHAAFYTDQSNEVFDNDTIDSREELGNTMDGYFSFGCDMAECKEDGKRTSIMVCHAAHDVPPKKKVISKAEYERRFGKIDDDMSSSTKIVIFTSILLSSITLFYSNVF